LLAWPATLAACALVFSAAIEPQMDPDRSGRAFMESALAAIPRDAELGLVEYKYQFLLYLDRPVVDFGHRRWIDALEEQRDAARWLDGAHDRALLVPGSQLKPCFENAPRRELGSSAGERWFLVRPPPESACAARGDPARALHFTPPALAERAPRD